MTRTESLVEFQTRLKADRVSKYTAESKPVPKDRDDDAIILPGDETDSE